MKEKTRRRLGTTAWVCVIVAIFTLTMAGIISMLNGKETTTTTSGNNENLTAVVCSLENPEEAFFSSDQATATKHDVRFTFNGDNIDKVSYTLAASFPSEEAAKSVLSEWHADYNIYMGKVGLDIETLNPNFTLLGSDVAVSLFANRDQFTSDTATFLFLNVNDFIKVRKYSAEAMQKFYETRNFSCKISE